MNTFSRNISQLLATGEWEVIVNHRCDLLTEHMIYSACAKHVRFKELGFSFDHPDSFFDSRTGDVWWKTSQIREIETHLLLPQQYEELTKRLQRALDDHRAYLVEFAEKRHRVSHDPSIIEDFFRRSEQTVATIFYFQLEKGTHKELERQGIPGHVIRSSLTDTTRAAQELSRIAGTHATEFKQNDLVRTSLSSELAEGLRQFVDRFGYLAMKYFQGHPWTVWEAYEMAQSALLQPKTHPSESKAVSTSPYVAFLEDMLRLRTEKWELMCYGSSLFRDMVIEHFSHLVHYDDLLSLKMDEVVDLFRGHFPPRALLEERRGFVVSSINHEVDMWIEKEEPASPRSNSDVKEVKGITAQPGKITGTVKVVMSPRECSKVKDGDILVATMSTPDFLPAMMRAAAFVTDIGGITSHAAIVSREMGRPCIIGTKIATKVLKDGDTVEVDADAGIVRRL